MEKSCFKGCFCSKEIKGCHSQFCRPQDSGIFRILSSYVKKGDTLCDNDTYVEDPRLQASGMTALCNGAFTLIELLVVVLIISILAAVAVPQYQRVVEISRAQQAYVWLNSLKKAQAVYYMANGKYAKDYEQLDIEIPFTTQHGKEYQFDDLKYRWSVWRENTGIAIGKKYADGAYSLQVDFRTGNMTCCASTKGNATSICHTLGFTAWYANTKFPFADQEVSVSCYYQSN